jgi:hypothetical protein
MYTVVQHSAFVAKRDTQFEKGLESAHVSTARQEAKIREAGGVLFPDYTEAEEYAMDEQYREVPGFGLTPKAPGTFTTTVTIEGRPVYIPKGSS